MKTDVVFLSSFKSLLSNDFSGLVGFEQLSSGETHLFLSGKIYNSKAETLLDRYIKEGEHVFRSIDGEFLIVLVQAKKITFFRDRHGAGLQLFYSKDDCTNRLLNFTAISGFDLKPNYEALFTFLSIGYIPSPQTSLDGVKKLAGGCMLEVESNLFTVKDLFDSTDFLASAGTTKLSLDEAVDEYERLHQKAVLARVENKTKVGLLLSGGYDSGGNISKLRDVYDGNVVTYSIGFKDNPWTELPLAKILSERYNSTHFEYEIDGSEIMDLPRIVAETGDPFQEGGLMLNYSAMRLVKESGENPQIILGGDGNDQHFGTSGKELALHWKFKKNGTQGFQKLFDWAGNNSLFEKDNLLFRSQFHNRKILHIQQSDIFGFTKHQLNTMNKLGYKMPPFEYLKSSPKSFKDFDQFFYCRNYFIDIKQVINEVILFKASKMAGMFSNNISFPYMSTDLYEFLKQMPVDYKFHGTLDELSKGKGQSKYLHKKYLKPKLPTEITDRKKQGGFAPLPIFLKEPVQRKIIFDFILKSAAVTAIFDRKKIQQLLGQYEKTANSSGYWFWFQQVQAHQIINLLTLVVWWELFMNGKTDIQSIQDLV